MSLTDTGPSGNTDSPNRKLSCVKHCAFESKVRTNSDTKHSRAGLGWAADTRPGPKQSCPGGSGCHPDDSNYHVTRK